MGHGVFLLLLLSFAVAAAFLCYDVLGTKLGGALLLCMCQKAMPFVIGGRAVARCKVARLRASKRQESYAKGSEKKKCFFLGFQKRR